MDLSTRKALLEEASEIITKDRNASYGEPNQDFTRTAKLWSAAFAHRMHEEQDFVSHDVAIAMILLKISRLAWNPDHKDSWLDIAGYAACGYESMVIDLAETKRGFGLEVHDA